MVARCGGRSTTPARLLSPQQDLAVWQQLVRSDFKERIGFSLTHPRAAAQRAQAAWNKLMMYDGAGLKDLWSAFQYDEDCQVFSDWARQYSARVRVSWGPCLAMGPISSC